MCNNIAIAVYENAYAPLGGIAAVMRCENLPGHLQSASGCRTIIITPYHYKIMDGADGVDGVVKKKKLKLDFAGTVVVPCDKGNVSASILRLDGECPHYFIKAADESFFGGKRHPYDVKPDILLRDSLFFGKAVALAFGSRDTLTGDATHGSQHWTVLMQDWEAATVALALAGERERYGLFLTLHNSYDTRVDDNLLESFGIDSKACAGSTVLERALRLVARRVFTVSSQFAVDLVEDPLQSVVMASHLAEKLRTRVLGVDNGLFIDTEHSKFDALREAIGFASKGDFGPLKKLKEERRRSACEKLRAHKPKVDEKGNDTEPIWGDVERFVNGANPWLAMGGRDDSRQKGYDVAAAAAAEFLKGDGKAQFLFFPMAGDEGLAGLDFLRELADGSQGRVLVLPFIWREGYDEAVQGSAFGIMPSLYEPFGAANEISLQGAVGIARATGGLVQQIVPWRAAASFSQAVQERASRWHTSSSRATGILYRERGGIDSAAEDWHGINEAKYEVGGKHPNRVEERCGYQLFRAMVKELRLAIADGVRLYENRPDRYFAMIAAGYSYILDSFSWQRAANEYVRQVSK
jgi:glycogen synthase